MSTRPRRPQLKYLAEGATYPESLGVVRDRQGRRRVTSSYGAVVLEVSCHGQRIGRFGMEIDGADTDFWVETPYGDRGETVITLGCPECNLDLRVDHRAVRGLLRRLRTAHADQGAPRVVRVDAPALGRLLG